jgi:uncharacterized repeat protein (TIGR03803 family)
MNKWTVTVGTWMLSAFLLSAQTFRVIYNFPSSQPYCRGVMVSSNTVYGTTQAGGVPDRSTLFKINTNGSGYQVIKTFSSTSGSSTNSDGAVPLAGMILCSNRLFGTTYAGGTGGLGTVFGVDPNGSNFMVLNHFNGTNGKAPYVGLTASGNILYGTTAAGGISNKGAIFQVNTDGTEFGLVKSFVTSDGFLLLSGVTLNGDTLYGTTFGAGLTNRGTIYSIKTNGDDFTTLHNFFETEGSQPRYQLVLAGNTLYGVTDGNGIESNSVIYRINTDGSGFAVIKRFSETDPNTGTNSDGSLLRSGLVMWKGVLYGATEWGGFNGTGVLFKLNPDGTGFAVLKHFSVPPASGYINADGMFPLSEVVVADDVLYGTTQHGGIYGGGTIYSLTIPPTPALRTVSMTGDPLIFWSDDQLNRTLQTTADLNSGNWTNVPSLNWTNLSSNPRQVGFQITNHFNAPAAFYRLQ